MPRGCTWVCHAYLLQPLLRARKMDSRMDINGLIQKRRYLLTGCPSRVSDSLSQFIYNRYTPFNSSQDSMSYGSVFNIEFTPSLYTVLVAHEKKALAVYDCRLEKRVMAVPNAHTNCVNVITFLDNFTFATGSDDQSVRLWDLRQCGSASSSTGDNKGLMYVLYGHKGWVKNVEYDRNSGHLFTMAFNDGVRRWDINNCHLYTSPHSNADDDDNLLFEAKEGARMRLSPDGRTMVVSLRKDHLFIVSDFNGQTLSSSFPQTPPLSVDDRDSISHLSSINTTNNIPTVHRLLPRIDNAYHSPLSLSFHPNSNRLLAMRVLGIVMYEHFYSVSEQLVLYDASQSREPYYESEENAARFLKSCREYSEDSSIDFIKEISFSSDGRVLVSPHGCTVRILALDDTCTPMDTYYDSRYHCTTTGDREFVCCGVGSSVEVKAHNSSVLTCRLNSDIMCLVSGCLEGKVFFTWPRL